jgi:diguanylate cyclase (GGDEF)-like protein
VSRKKTNEFLGARIRKSISKEFKLYNLKTNLNRGMIISGVTLIMVLLIVLSNLFVEKNLSPSLMNGYYIMYFSFIAIVGVLLVCMIRVKKSPHVNRATTWLIRIFAGYMLTWNMVISILDGDIISYITALLALSILAVLNPRFTIILYIAVEIAYCALVLLFEPDSHSRISFVMNSIVAATVSWVAGYMLYKNRADNFSSQKEVQEQREELRVLNEELNEANKKLEYLSQTDGLTGIYNRRMFDEISSLLWEESKESSSCLAVIMIDIDHFKLFNDTYGHLKGDECLKSIVNKIKEAIPYDSMLARYGGEEFAIMVKNCSMSEALGIAEEIRATVAGLRIPHENSPVKPYVTLSLGVHCKNAGEGTIAQHIELADKALYKAKEGGRNMVAVL